MTAALPLALLLLAARPVAKPVRGSLDALQVKDDGAGVLVRFLGVSKSKAQEGLDRVAQSNPGLRIGFVRTQASSIAALYATQGSVTLQRLKDLAAACSRLDGATSAYVFLHPGPRNHELEAESYWEYVGGALKRENRIAWRDDETWMSWVRKRTTTAELEAKKWPGWPLSDLAVQLGIPGRDFLVRPQAMLELAEAPWPRDVGPNLVLTVVSLPDATVLEMRQLSETRNVSVSKVVHDALAKTDEEQKLGVQIESAGRAPWEDDGPHADKSPPREIELFLTRALFDKLDAQAEAESSSFSKMVERAWRQAHPFVDPKKKR